MRLDSTSKPPSRRIRILREDVARKIAAGEVIDRPLSVLRELLDNALDSGASTIEAEWENGGLTLLRVSDDGDGIPSDDLPLSILPHATSKITDESDLLALSSLGFRGEALASIASVASLTLHSSTASEIGAELVVHGVQEPRLTTLARPRGTTVSVRDLFLNVPARRKFMKSPSSESGACRKTFDEKILPFPGVSFRLKVDGRMVALFPACSLLDRGRQVLEKEVPPACLHLAEGAGSGWSLEAVWASPQWTRRDRSWIHVYVNKRRVTEYSLVQAVHYAFREYQPGGAFPFCLVYLQVDPAQADFNIHPAKREVRLAHLAAIHHGLVETLRSALSSTLPQSMQRPPALDFPRSLELLKPRSESIDKPEVLRPLPENQAIPWRYIGQVMRLYLLVEWQGKLLVVDQHAAHERIHFDRLRAHAKATQPLLVPLEINLENDAYAVWASTRSRWEQIGIVAENPASSTLRVTSIPAAAQGMESEVEAFLREAKGSEADLERELYARLACRASIMAGEDLDRYSAELLLTQVFALEVPRCPHGRPLWIEWNREGLDQMFGR